MSSRLKEGKRQQMLMDYVKKGDVPEGFYVKNAKDGRIQFRKIKPMPSKEDAILKKISCYEKKISNLRNLLETDGEK